MDNIRTRQTPAKRHREARRQRAPEEDCHRPVAQQAAKRVGRRLGGLVLAHREQQCVRVQQAVERVQRHLVANDFVAKRHDLVDTALRPWVPEEWGPIDLRHAVINMVGCARLGQHVNQARQGLVPRLNTPGMRATAVADASVVRTLVDDGRDPIDHLDRAHVCVVRAARLKLASHL